VERILSGCLGDVLVGTNASCFERLRAQLLVLIRNEMTAEGELVDRSTFTAKVENPDLLGGEDLSDEPWVNKLWDQGHHGCTVISGRACSCSNDSSERDDDPLL